MRLSDNHVNVSSVLSEATGTENTVPLLARTRLGFPQSVTGSAATTASTPAASAVRSIAPRLPGFSTPWQISTSGVGPTRRSVQERTTESTTACLLYTSPSPRDRQ